MPCQEGQKFFGFGFVHCNGEEEPCVLCGQLVCAYHGASNNEGAVGGHSGCREQCMTNFPQKCRGHMSRCRGCNSPYCKLHVDSCGFCARGSRRSLHCDEGQRSPGQRSLCSGGVQPCALCGQSVCNFHAPAANRQAQGGHEGCRAVCATDRPEACAGYMMKCPGCDRHFCKRHSQQTAESLARGGHQCTVYCQTTRMTRKNCEGEIRLCRYCPHMFCDYHYEPAKHVWQLVGGHVCRGRTPGSRLSLGWDGLAGGQEAVEHRASSVFEGRVFSGGADNACVVSFPGKFIEMWDDLVRSGRDRKLSTACVFLPEDDPKERFGAHSSQDPALSRDRCWCYALYGEEKPWGCRWFADWRDNVERAVHLGLELVVVFFPGKVDRGVLEWDDLRRQGAQLWSAPGGLGGSQKGEVAWLRKNRLPYRSMDVDEVHRRYGLRLR